MDNKKDDKNPLYDYLPQIWESVSVLRGGYFTSPKGLKVANPPFAGIPDNSIVVLDIPAGAVLNIGMIKDVFSATLQTIGGSVVIDSKKFIGDETLIATSDRLIQNMAQECKQLSPDYELNMKITKGDTKQTPEEIYSDWVYEARRAADEAMEAAVDESTKSAEDLHFAGVEHFLDNLIGLEELKTTLKRFLAILKFAEKTKGSIPLERPNLHMIFKGNPGTGKTSVAVKLAELYGELGFLGSDGSGPVKLTIVNGANLLTEEAAVKVKKLVDDACGGILLIDEAYAITESHRGIGDEIIAMLLTEMEMKREELAVILAGYTAKMDKFTSINPGLRSRVGATINFEDYTPDQLLTMLTRKFNSVGLTVTPEARNRALQVFGIAVRYNDFGNGRFVADFYEDILAQHSVNTANIYTLEELKTIKEKDVTENIIKNIIKGANFKS